MNNMKLRTFQRGQDEIIGLIALAIFALILWLFGVSFGIENEGTVKFDDCREIITIDEYSWQKYLRQFTCSYVKTQSGKIMSGECVNIVNDGSLFGNSHACAKAYIYKKSASEACKGNIVNGVAYPYLGQDDKCYTTPQY